jgi:hypothetical protein
VPAAFLFRWDALCVESVVFGEGNPSGAYRHSMRAFVTLLGISHGGYLAYKATPHTARGHGNGGGG